MFLYILFFLTCAKDRIIFPNKKKKTVKKNKYGKYKGFI
jgi:hypothetical protein